jgi:hypothetical protein
MLSERLGRNWGGGRETEVNRLGRNRVKRLRRNRVERLRRNRVERLRRN